MTIALYFIEIEHHFMIFLKLIDQSYYIFKSKIMKCIYIMKHRGFFRHISLTIEFFLFSEIVYRGIHGNATKPSLHRLEVIEFLDRPEKLQELVIRDFISQIFILGIRQTDPHDVAIVFFIEYFFMLS